MNGVQFEELCRRFVAKTLGMRVEEVRWLRVPAAVRPGQAADTYQVDLWWETASPLGRYVTIADAKWRVRQKIDRIDVLLLEQFRIGAGAHKAMLISNAQFTAGVLRTAERLGIAVHRLEPTFPTEGLPRTNRAQIQQTLDRLSAARPLWRHGVVCKGVSRRSRPQSGHS